LGRQKLSMQNVRRQSESALQESRAWTSPRTKRMQSVRARERRTTAFIFRGVRGETDGRWNEREKKTGTSAPIDPNKTRKEGGFIFALEEIKSGFCGNQLLWLPSSVTVNHHHITSHHNTTHHITSQHNTTQHNTPNRLPLDRFPSNGSCFGPPSLQPVLFLSLSLVPKQTVLCASPHNTKGRDANLHAFRPERRSALVLSSPDRRQRRAEGEEPLTSSTVSRARGRNGPREPWRGQR